VSDVRAARGARSTVGSAPEDPAADQPGDGQDRAKRQPAARPRQRAKGHRTRHQRRPPGLPACHRSETAKCSPAWRKERHLVEQARDIARLGPRRATARSRRSRSPAGAPSHLPLERQERQQARPASRAWLAARRAPPSAFVEGMAVHHPDADEGDDGEDRATGYHGGR